MKFIKISILFSIFIILTILNNVSDININFNINNIRTRFKLRQYDYKETVTSSWNLDIAKGYRDLAGLGYVNKSSATAQLTELNIKPPLTKDVTKIFFFF